MRYHCVCIREIFDPLVKTEFDLPSSISFSSPVSSMNSLQRFLALHFNLSLYLRKLRFLECEICRSVK